MSAGGRRVRVAVPVAQVAGALTYGVPAGFSSQVVPGVRVEVPVGRRKVVGVVLGDDDDEAPSGLKLITAVLDEEPVVTPPQLALVEFVSRYYLAPIGEAMRLVLPPDTARDVGRIYRRTEKGDAATVFGAAHGLTALEQSLLSTFDEGRARSSSELRAARVPRARLDKLAALGFLEATEAKAAGAVRHDVWVTPLEGGEPLPPRSPALAALEAWMRAGEPPFRLDEMALVFPGAKGKLKRLEALGRVRLDEAVRTRKRKSALKDHGPGDKTLTDAQASAVEALLAAHPALRDEGAPAPAHTAFLLEGVTGSGKTEVYLRLLSRTVETGRGALFVVPEIALTPQLLARVERALPDETVSVLHSGLSLAERRDALARLARGESKVAVGARSALFAPVKDLGLIVVDEEHDPSYKQSESPRYHGRDVALWRARAEHALCVLGSATPSLESRHNVDEGKLAHLELPTRIGGGGWLPEIEVIDLRARGQLTVARKVDRALDEGPGVILSRPLRDALSQTLERNEQAVLFLNRRGYASVLLCEACGNILECPHCSVALTLHKGRHSLVCHQCDFAMAPPSGCPDCKGNLVALGLGTERVESEVRAAFPDARIARLDRDTTREKGSLERVLARVQKREVDVLIGTQMVAKGHDFPGITLVGIILADIALGLPDFRAAERAFALITQVAGRAGRGETKGRVLLQTYNPAHPALAYAVHHDVKGFSAAELALREEARYPPFWRVALYRVEGEDPTAVDAIGRRVAERFRQFARAQLPPGTWDVLGPAPAPIERLRGKTRHQVFVRAKELRHRAQILGSIARDADLEAALKRTSCRLILDVDPIGML